MLEQYTFLQSIFLILNNVEVVVKVDETIVSQTEMFVHNHHYTLTSPENCFNVLTYFEPIEKIG